MRTVKKTLTLCVVIDSLHKEHLTTPKLKKKKEREKGGYRCKSQKLLECTVTLKKKIKKPELNQVFFFFLLCYSVLSETSGSQ